MNIVCLVNRLLSVAMRLVLFAALGPGSTLGGLPNDHRHLPPATHLPPAGCHQALPATHHPPSIITMPFCLRYLVKHCGTEQFPVKHATEATKVREGEGRDTVGEAERKGGCEPPTITTL